MVLPTPTETKVHFSTLQELDDRINLTRKVTVVMLWVSFLVAILVMTGVDVWIGLGVYTLLCALSGIYFVVDCVIVANKSNEHPLDIIALAFCPPPPEA